MNNVGYSSTQENPNCFAAHWMGSGMGLRYALARILWHGGLKSSTMTIIVDSDMFGMTRLFIDVLELTLNTSF